MQDAWLYKGADKPVFTFCYLEKLIPRLWSDMSVGESETNVTNISLIVHLSWKSALKANIMGINFISN